MEFENKKLELEEIDLILKNHGIDFFRCGGHYWIKEDGQTVEQFFQKRINSIEKIRNWLGY